jgi:CRISPR-associated RAMP protein (TIGR02581 family)
VYNQLLNEALLELTISPAGPILIKASEGAGADPTHPDMEFVRTLGQVYLPGSSLKGVVRAHAERIVRAFQTENSDGRGACDPLDRDASCGSRLRNERRTTVRYARSCRICRLFGNTVLASRARFTDAMPRDALTTEQRNGVAIDRVYGSASGGALFNYEIATEGTFWTRIYLRNFTLAQLALIGLALRDLGEGRVGLGFGKSRGLGQVTIGWGRLELRYPLASLKTPPPPSDKLLGVGALCAPALSASYDFPRDDRTLLPKDLRFADDGWCTLRAVAEGKQPIEEVFRAVTEHWRGEVGHA